MLCLPSAWTITGRSLPLGAEGPPAFLQAEAAGSCCTSQMSSHKGSAAAQGNGAPAANREADSVELTELGPLLEEKGKRAITSPTKVSPSWGVLLQPLSPWPVVGLCALGSHLP